MRESPMKSIFCLLFLATGCATTGAQPASATIGTSIVVQPQDDPAAVQRALTAVSDGLEDAERRLQELEQRSRPIDAAPEKTKTP